MREKLSLPIGIREPSGSAKAPPAARSDNALRKERGGRRTRIRAGPPAGGVARRAGKINPRALCGKREQSPPAVPYFLFFTPLPCVAAFHRPAALLSSPHADPAKEARADLPAGRAVVPVPRVAPSSPHADPAKEARTDLPAGRAVAPVPCVAPSSPHADPAKEAHADLPVGRAVVHAPRRSFHRPCRSRKRGSRRPSRGAGGRSRLPRRAFIAPCRSRQRGARRPSRGAGDRSRPAALLSSPRADTERGACRPSRRAGGCSLLSQRSFHRPMPIPQKRLTPTFPRDGRLFSPLAALLSSPHADPAKEARADLPAERAVAPVPCVAPSSLHADPAKEARADLPAGRAVVPFPCGVPGRTKKTEPKLRFFCCLFTPWNR